MPPAGFSARGKSCGGMAVFLSLLYRARTSGVSKRKKRPSFKARPRTRMQICVRSFFQLVKKRLLFLVVLLVAAFAKAESRSFCFLVRFFGTSTFTFTRRSPRPLPFMFGMPLPLSEKIVPVCAPSGIWNSELPSSVGHGHLGAESRLREGYRHFEIYVVALAFEGGMRTHRHDNDKVAARPAVQTRAALAGKRNALSVVYACGDRHLKRLFLAHKSGCRGRRCRDPLLILP